MWSSTSVTQFAQDFWWTYIYLSEFLKFLLLLQSMSRLHLPSLWLNEWVPDNWKSAHGFIGLLKTLLHGHNTRIKFIANISLQDIHSKCLNRSCQIAEDVGGPDTSLPAYECNCRKHSLVLNRNALWVIVGFVCIHLALHRCNKSPGHVQIYAIGQVDRTVWASSLSLEYKYDYF